MFRHDRSASHGFDALDAGKSHLAVTCVMKHVPFRLLPQLRLGDKLLDLPRRMKCERCGQRRDEVHPIAQSDARGYVR
jgi:hypothetical protein